MKITSINFTLTSLLFFAWVASSYLHIARAQEIRAEVSRNPVAVGEVFRITYKSNVQFEDFRMPRLSDFSIVGGPYQSFSQTFINGRLSMSMSISYDLIPQKKGKYIVGAATARYEGRTITSNTLEIEVVEGQVPAPRAPGREPETRQQVASDNQDIFIQAFTSKSSVYPGEPFVLTVKLFTRLQTELKDVIMPRLKGAYIQEIPDAADRQFRVEVHNGQRYYVAVLRKLVVVAQKPGTLNLGKAGAEVKYQIVERTGDFWQDFFSGGRLRIFEKNLESAPIIIHVKDFPTQGKPASFTGACGVFEMHNIVEPSRIQTGDAVKFRLRLSGQGNLPLTELPRLQLPPSFEVFEPKTTDKVAASEAGLSGYRETELIAIPRSPGEFKIVIPEFSWFDYKAEKYRIHPVEEITLTVEGAQLAGGGTSVISPGKKEVGILQDDIRYLKRQAFGNYAGDKDSSTPAWGWLLLPWAATVGLFLVRPTVRRLRQEAEAAPRGRRSTRRAMDLLRQAEKALAEGQSERFYELCARAVYQFLHDRFRLPLHSTDRSMIRQALSNDPEKGEGFVQVLDECEAARYAPTDATARLDLLVKCRTLIEHSA
ncbi:MAG: BatD family protein [Flavobacteriales bacterium]|nr:BatD family protein [Flavobacteriales bacterium]